MFTATSTGASGASSARASAIVTVRRIYVCSWRISLWQILWSLLPCAAARLEHARSSSNYRPISPRSNIVPKEALASRRPATLPLLTLHRRRAATTVVLWRCKQPGGVLPWARPQLLRCAPERLVPPDVTSTTASLSGEAHWHHSTLQRILFFHPSQKPPPLRVCVLPARCHAPACCPPPRESSPSIHLVADPRAPHPPPPPALATICPGTRPSPMSI